MTDSPIGYYLVHQDCFNSERREVEEGRQSLHGCQSPELVAALQQVIDARRELINHTMSHIMDTARGAAIAPRGADTGTTRDQILEAKAGFEAFRQGIRTMLGNEYLVGEIFIAKSSLAPDNNPSLMFTLYRAWGDDANSYDVSISMDVVTQDMQMYRDRGALSAPEMNTSVTFDTFEEKLAQILAASNE